MVSIDHVEAQEHGFGNEVWHLFDEGRDHVRGSGKTFERDRSIRRNAGEKGSYPRVEAGIDHRTVG